MASVIDYIECPNCKQEAYSDFYYKTGEEYVNCTSCGYHYSATITNRDKKLSELTDADWEIKELKTPYGAYRIKYYDCPGYACGALGDIEQVSAFKKIYEQDDSIETVQLSRFVDGKIKIEMIIDNGPKIDGAGFSIEDRI